MIKINLARTRVTTAEDVANFQGRGGGGGGGEDSGGTSQRDSIVKLLASLMFVAGLYIYESQNISSLNAEVGRLSTELAQLQEVSQAKEAEAEKVKEFEKQARELEDKLKILKTLSRLRLREVKTLDFMQSSIPEKVWVKKIGYSSGKENLTLGSFDFEGYAIATEDLSEFARRLEDSTHLRDVIVTKNQENDRGPTTYREFLFSAEVEASL